MNHRPESKLRAQDWCVVTAQFGLFSELVRLIRGLRGMGLASH